MQKRSDAILNTIIGSFFGAFIGYSAFKYLDFVRHPGIYEMSSTPWYTGIKICGLATSVIVFIAFAIKCSIKRKLGASDTAEHRHIKSD